MNLDRGKSRVSKAVANQWRGGIPLPRDFRKLSFEERREALRTAILAPKDTGSAGLNDSGDADFDEGALGSELLDLSDIMIETAVGYLPVPLGIASGFLIDGYEVAVPMAVEEPSVVAAATFAAHLIAGTGGFATWAGEPRMIAQIFLEKTKREAAQEILRREGEIAEGLTTILASMTRRGGGLRGINVERIEALGLLRVDITIDVRDSMGANLLNAAAEAAKDRLAAISGGAPVMSILTNEAKERLAGARFEIPLERLRRGGLDGAEVGRRVALASEIARVDASRAVTHNKGVMNGISALALATGNDTRGIEAAVHRYAARDGAYRGVTRFFVAGASLRGEIEIPLPFAAAGGSVGLHPATAFCLDLLGRPDGPTLARIAAAVGLAQNFAAILALVTDGIQKGHMELHAARIARAAGARSEEIREVARLLAERGRITREGAEHILRELHRREAEARQVR